jgi:hypothetical protein
MEYSYKQYMEKTPTKSPNLREMGAVVATGVLHLVLIPLGARGIFILLAVCFWVVFIIIRIRNNSGIMREWGFRWDNIKEAFSKTSLYCLPMFLGMVIFAVLKGTLTFPPHMIIPILLYPLWGIIQQFLVLSLMVRNISFTKFGSRKINLVLAGAILFSLVHAPDLKLMTGTFILGLIYVTLYLRYKNILPLGVYHGWLGTFFYLWVTGTAPWLEMITAYLSL